MEEKKRIRHAIVNQENKVVNVVIWNGHPWLPPHGHIVVQDDRVNIGDIYVPETGTFIQGDSNDYTEQPA